MKWSTLGCVVASIGGAMSLASTASAQDPAPAPATPAPTPPPTPAAAPPAPAPVPPEDTTTDHGKFVGHFGIGYLGVQAVPLAGNPDINAPVIGARYWLTEMIGIDAGIGFWTQGGSTTAVVGTMTTSTDHPTATAFLFHGGVPLSLAAGRHYSFQVVPELNLGLSTQTVKGMGAMPPPDTTNSGFRFDLGAHVGGEIHFGFIGIPELALQAYVGLYVQRVSTKTSQNNNSVSDGTTQIATSYNGQNPWSIFTNSIAALYYF